MEYALAMPATQFFTMLKEGRRLKAAEYRVQCDIQAISICSVKYYEQVRAQFDDQKTAKKKVNTMDLSRDQRAAADMMRAMFGSRERH